MIIEDGRVLPHFLILENPPRGIIFLSLALQIKLDGLQFDGV